MPPISIALLIAGMTPRRLAAFVLIWLACAGAALAACPERQPGTDVAVGIRHAAPFVEIDRNALPRGLAVDIWESVSRPLVLAGKIGSIEYILCPSIGDQGAALASGALDVVISPLTITAERMQSYAFSQQYLGSGLTVARRESSAIDFEHAIGVVADTIAQPGVLRAVLGFLAFNLIVAFLIRQALRAQDDADAAAGGGFVVYALEAIVRTAGLKGVGDRFRTTAGRILEIFMAVVGTALSATLFGVLTSAFVGAIGAQEAVPIEDVLGQRVATLNASTAREFLITTDARITGTRNDGLCVALANAGADARCMTVSTWEEAIGLVVEGRADLVLGDWVALSYLARSDRFAGKVAVQAQSYLSEPYGWGITPLRPDLRAAIDQVLIEEMRQPGWRKRIESALGQGAINPE